MSINVQCDSCNSSFKVKDEFAGKRGKCPSCGLGVQVPPLPGSRTEIAEPQTAQIVHAEPAPPQLIAIQQRVEVHKEETNGLGTAGFVVSLVGVLTCGFLSPVGFLFSLIALFNPPRGMAIAGTVLGGLGSLWLVFVGFTMVLGIIGIGAVVESVEEIRTTVRHVSDTSEEIMKF